MSATDQQTQTDAAASVRTAAAVPLDQIAEIARSIEPAVYTHPERGGGGATIGKHVRHALDHYAALLERPAGTPRPVAYDHRVRGGEVETDPAAARRRAAELRASLERLDHRRLAAEVRLDVVVSPDEPEVPLRSTLGRELAFVAHHATHHLAMIKSLARDAGVELPARVGRAPSTLAHDRTT